MLASKSTPTSNTWCSAHGDSTDEEWILICDLFSVYGGYRRIGRAPKWEKRDIVNAILYVVATGCQCRALPSNYPHWNTVHRYHVQWSRRGTWKRAGEKLSEMIREKEGRDPDPSADVSMLVVYEVPQL